MDSKIINFIAKEQVCALSVLLSDGVPHIATVHYSHTENPLRIFIQTSNTTTKAKALVNRENAKAAIVIGFSEEDWLTLQMRGDIKIVSNKDELEEIYKIHYKKHPDAEQYKGPQTIFLEFKPTWWRFTDFNTDPETIVEQ